jgi:hypothetical protein
VLAITCQCRRVVHFRRAALHHLRVPVETPIADIVPHLKCKNCGAREGFAVTIEESRDGSVHSERRPPRMVIAKPD